MSITAVLFDFDGTLVETRTSSWVLFEETNRQFDLGLDAREDFFRLFDGNFFASLSAHCGDEATAHAAAAHFMQLLKERYEPEFIPGIIDVVRALAAETTLAILSSNTQDTICRILHSGGIANCFPYVITSEAEPSKAKAIARFLDGAFAPNPCSGGAPRREINAAPHPPKNVAMITDTVGDVREGVACGIEVYGVNWGMHNESSLHEAGALHTFRAPEEIFKSLVTQRRTTGVARTRQHA